jgi:hypothetical protein
MQTNLKSSDMCGYNQSASPFYWSFQPHQYENTFAYGEVGVNSQGGAAGSYIRPNVIDISSFLSGRDDVLSRCVPPTPSLESLNAPTLYGIPKKDTAQPITGTEGPMVGSLKPSTEGNEGFGNILYPQNQVNTEILIPQYTKEKRSANDLDVIDFNRYQPNLPADAQRLTDIIENMASQRGGMDTQNFVKSAWKPQNGPQFNQDPNICRMTLRPDIGDTDVTGYPGQNPLTGKQLHVNYEWAGKPPGQENYPFIGPTSQNIVSVGSDDCGPNYFHGPNSEFGSCPPTKQTVLQGSALSPEQFPLPNV